MKIHASASGPHEPSASKIHVHSAVPRIATTTMPTRSRALAQWGCTASRVSAGSETIERLGSVPSGSRTPRSRARRHVTQP